MRTLLGELGIGIIAAGLLVVWFIAVTVTVPLFSLVGVPQQVTAGGVSVVFFVAFWAVGLKFLFGGSGEESS